jgi:hypothetical protein
VERVAHRTRLLHPLGLQRRVTLLTAQQLAIITIMVFEPRMPHQGVAMRTSILIPSALLIVAFGSGCDISAATVKRSIDAPASSVAGNCPAGTGPMRPVGAGAAVDRNKDGYGCVGRRSPIAGDSLLPEVDNDASSAGGAPQRDPIWDALYTGM